MSKYDVSRFVRAQEETHTAAVRELRNGEKLTHWSWWEIPQITGLGSSYTSQRYAISSIGEAKAFLQNETLRSHLLEICEALLSLETNDARAVMGAIDHRKLRSCMTLFLEADPECAEFRSVLEKYYGGKKDHRTLAILRKQSEE
ncbi:MAG: DUF1810 domain-containing protein [Lachnospiraceae bacterium]|nr:DUF1810 domain-containing protein [Lachnospiraceae bacterium]